MASMASITILCERIIRFSRIRITPIEMECIMASRSRRTPTRRLSCMCSMRLLLTQQAIQLNSRVAKAVGGEASSSTRTARAGRRRLTSNNNHNIITVAHLMMNWTTLMMVLTAKNTGQTLATQQAKAASARSITMCIITTPILILTFITITNLRWM